MGMSASQARLMSLTSRMSDLELKAQAIQNNKIRLADMGEQASRKYSEALDKQLLNVKDSSTSSYVTANVNNLVSYTKDIDLDSTNSKYRYIETASGKLVLNKATIEDTGATVDSDGNFDTSDMREKDEYMAQHVKPKAGGTDFSDEEMQTASYKYYSNIFDKIVSHQVEVLSEKNSNSSEWLTQQIELGNIFLYEYDDKGGSNGTGAYKNITWNSGDASLSMIDDKTDYAKAEAEYETTMASIQSKDKRFDLELTELNTEHKAIETEMDSVKKIIDKNIERSFKTFNG